MKRVQGKKPDTTHAKLLWQEEAGRVVKCKSGVDGGEIAIEQ